MRNNMSVAENQNRLIYGEFKILKKPTDVEERKVAVMFDTGADHTYSAVHVSWNFQFSLKNFIVMKFLKFDFFSDESYFYGLQNGVLKLRAIYTVAA